jgi:hypothetical protein
MTISTEMDMDIDAETGAANISQDADDASAASSKSTQTYQGLEDKPEWLPAAAL